MAQTLALAKIKYVGMTHIFDLGIVVINLVRFPKRVGNLTLIIDQPGGQGHVSKSGASSGPLTQPSQLIRVRIVMIMIILMIGGMIMIRVMMMTDDQNQS